MDLEDPEYTIFKLEEELKQSHAKNIKLYSQLQNYKGDILTLIKIRPEDGESVIDINDESSLNIQSLDNRSTSMYQFHGCLPPQISQDDVFYELEHVIYSALSGYHISIFAYGQTGSGKTYTMLGTPENPGITFNIVDKLLELSNLPVYQGLRIKLSMLEVYNESIYDILSKTERRKQLDFNANEGFDSLKCKYKYLESVDAAEAIVKYGMTQRTTASTDLNEHSSRSHCIITLLIEKEQYDSKKTIGKISLIDLAGSERVSHSQVVGQRLIEAQYINKSLSSLGNVIKALGEKQSHIPYRDSVLTLLLKDSISYNSKVIMIVTIRSTPSFLNETYSSLLFADKVYHTSLGKVKKIENDKQLQLENRGLRQTISSLRSENSKLKNEYEAYKKISENEVRKYKDMLQAKQYEYQLLQKEDQNKIEVLKSEQQKLQQFQNEIKTTNNKYKTTKTQDSQMIKQLNLKLSKMKGLMESKEGLFAQQLQEYQSKIRNLQNQIDTASTQNITKTSPNLTYTTRMNTKKPRINASCSTNQIKAPYYVKNTRNKITSTNDAKLKSISQNNMNIRPINSVHILDPNLFVLEENQSFNLDLLTPIHSMISINKGKRSLILNKNNRIQKTMSINAATMNKQSNIVTSNPTSNLLKSQNSLTAPKSDVLSNVPFNKDRKIKSQKSVPSIPLSEIKRAIEKKPSYTPQPIGHTFRKTVKSETPYNRIGPISSFKEFNMQRKKNSFKKF